MRRREHWLLAIALTAALALEGCSVNSSSSGGRGTRETVVGDEDQVNYSVDHSFQVIAQILRDQRIPFEAKDHESILTAWEDARVSQGITSGTLAARARYRYEILIQARGNDQSTIIANIRAENMSEDEIDANRPNKSLDLFGKFAQTANTNYVSQSGQTRGDGMKFVPLPDEGLRQFAMRITGHADNDRQIGLDNHLDSGKDLPIKPIWVSSTLLQSPSTTEREDISASRVQVGYEIMIPPPLKSDQDQPDVAAPLEKWKVLGRFETVSGCVGGIKSLRTETANRYDLRNIMSRFVWKGFAEEAVCYATRA